jgi:hypothetical protein
LVIKNIFLLTQEHIILKEAIFVVKIRRKMLRKILLFCGFLSSLAYAGMDLIGGLQWQNYNWISQEFSRLSAIGAPSRHIHLIMNVVYILLVFFFGVGVWQSAKNRRSLRIIGLALILYAIVSWIWPQFFPEDLSKHVSDFTNTMHIVLTGVTLLTWMVILIVAVVSFSKQFRIYSIVTMISILLFGALTGPQAVALAAGQPTPWLGLTERINIYSFMVWVVVFAILLLRMKDNGIQKIKR